MGKSQVIATPNQSGPVAQLGARFHGMEEVVGSIPTRSTKSLNSLEGGAPATTAIASWFVRVRACKDVRNLLWES